MKKLIFFSLLFGAISGNIARLNYDRSFLVYARTPIKQPKSYGKLARFSNSILTPTPTQKEYTPETETEKRICVKFGADCQIASAVAFGESHHNCKAIGDNGESIGLFQINKVHWAKYGYDNLLDCDKNIEAAYDIYTSQGNFSAWSVFNSGQYLAYL